MNYDSLTQWRYYGDDGSGVAIGINPRFIRGEVNRRKEEPGVAAFPIHYVKEKFEELAGKKRAVNTL